MHQVTNGAFNFIDKTAYLSEGVQVWHFAVVMEKVFLGRNVSIGSCSEIGKGSRIGDDSRIGHGVFLPYNSEVGERTFIAPGVYACDDKYPRVNNKRYEALPPVIGDDVTIGAGAILLPGVKIGNKAFIAAGAIVTKDVPEGGHVRGEPSRLKALTHFDVYAPTLSMAQNETHLLPV